MAMDPSSLLYLNLSPNAVWVNVFSLFLPYWTKVRAKLMDPELKETGFWGKIRLLRGGGCEYLREKALSAYPKTGTGT
jgi:hypothetical protein